MSISLSNTSAWKKIVLALLSVIVTCLVLEVIYRGVLAVGAARSSADIYFRVTTDPLV